jgi:hypothetical protein
MQTAAPFVEFAHQLLYIHGARAEAEAAQHAHMCAKMGDEQTAEMWHRVEATISMVRAGTYRH